MFIYNTFDKSMNIEDYTSSTAERTVSKRQTDLLKTGILILVIASSVFFFRIVFLSKNQIYIIQFATILFLFLIILMQTIYWKIPLYKQSFTTPVFLIFAGVFLSMLTAKVSHNQGFGISLWAQRSMYFYVFYFVLHILKVPIKTLEKIIIISGVIYAFAFLIQYFAFPKVIFDVRQGVERGTIRIFLPGLAIMNLAYFIALTRIIFKNALNYIPYILLFFCIYILTGTRSMIAGPTIVTILVLILSNKIKSKALIIFLVISIVGTTYYMFQDIITNLVSISQEQTAHSEEDIRVRAAKFFLTDFFPNKIAYITGNGEGHQASPFGLAINAFKINYGYYQSDIGIIGEYTKYGAFFVLGVVILLYKGIFFSAEPRYQYIRYFFILTLISLPLAQGFTTPGYIITICILMYIIDRRKEPKPKNRRPIVYFEELDTNNQEIYQNKKRRV